MAEFGKKKNVLACQYIIVPNKNSRVQLSFWSKYQILDLVSQPLIFWLRLLVNSSYWRGVESTIHFTSDGIDFWLFAVKHFLALCFFASFTKQGVLIISRAREPAGKAPEPYTNLDLYKNKCQNINSISSLRAFGKWQTSFWKHRHPIPEGKQQTSA